MAAAIYQISVRRKWKPVALTLGISAGLLAFAGAGMYGWVWFQNRPHEVNEFVGVTLGMTPIEVKLALGDPDMERSPEDGAEDNETENPPPQDWIYGNPFSESIDVRFDEQGVRTRVSTVCRTGGYEQLLGIGPGTSEDAVVARLGQPDWTSIRSDGLAKVISYSTWNVAYTLSQRRVTERCITEWDAVRYRNEYLEENPNIPRVDIPQANE